MLETPTCPEGDLADICSNIVTSVSGSSFFYISRHFVASAASALLMSLQLAIWYYWFLIAILELRIKLMLLPPNLVNRFLLRVYFLCTPPIVNALFYVLFIVTKFEQLYNHLVLRLCSFVSNFVVKLCIPALLYYATFSFLILSL